MGTGFMFFYSKLLGCLKSRFFLTGLALAICVWIVEPFIDAAFLQRGSFYQQLTQPDTFEIFERSIISAIIIIFSFIGSILLNRSKQAEEALRESEKRLLEAQRMAHVGNWDWDIVSNTIHWSDEVYRIYGMSRDDEPILTRERIMESLHPDDCDRISRNADLIVESGGGNYNEYRIIRPDGSIRVVSSRREANRLDNDGNIIGLVGTVHDITELKQVEVALRESEKKYRDLLESAPDGMVIVNAKGEIELVNQQLQKMTGYLPDDLTGQPVEVLIPERFEAHKQQRSSYVENPRVRMMGERLELYVQCKDGSELPVEISLSPLATEDGLMISAAIRDITERKLAEAALHESHQLISAVIDVPTDMIYIKGIDGRFILANSVMQKYFGVPMEEIIGKTNADLFSNDERAKEIDIEDRKVISTGKSFNYERTEEIKGKILARMTTKFPYRNAEGKIIGVIGVSRDITERKLAEEAIKENEVRFRHMAQHDILTGLPNRVLLSDRLQQAITIAKRDKKYLAVMFLDLDNFKPVNDMFGHSAGDLLLKEAAKRIQDCVRESDTVARISGDEFIVLFRVIEQKQDVMMMAEKIRNALNQPFELEGQNLQISSSTGIAIYPEHGTDENQILKNADVAMYCAKNNGKNMVQLFQPEMLRQKS